MVVVSLAARFRAGRWREMRPCAETITIRPDAQTETEAGHVANLSVRVLPIAAVAAHASVNAALAIPVGLHKQVMTRLAANGGKLPPEIKH
jgi:hypothetical protein